MEKIAIIDTGYRDYRYEEELFARNGFDLILYSGNVTDTLAKARFASGCSGILVRGTIIDSSFMDHTPLLRAIVRYGVGYDNIALPEATSRGIKVANVQGYASHSVSDHAIALMFACIRSIPEGSARITEIFSKPPSENIFELHDKCAGIVGLGRIGGCLASKIRGLFREVYAYDPYIAESRFTSFGVTRSDLQSLLRKSDVISINCNLTSETQHLINDKAFRTMDRKPVLINTARGAVIDQDALLAALRENRIHSAGIDVFEQEPPGEKEKLLFSQPGIIATGHYAWYSDYAMITLQKRAADNIISLLSGNRCEDQLNDV